MVILSSFRWQSHSSPPQDVQRPIRDRQRNCVIFRKKAFAALIAFLCVSSLLSLFSQESIFLADLGSKFMRRYPPSLYGDIDNGIFWGMGGKERLNLDDWREEQEWAFVMQKQSAMKCHSLTLAKSSTGRVATIVWAYDGPPDRKRLKATIASLPKDTKVQLLCGSASCEERANSIRMAEKNACLQVDRLSVPELARHTPLESWTNHHVLAKLLAGHHYEHHLQIAMQLAALWKYGGILLQPGIKYDAKLLELGEFLGSCKNSIAASWPNSGGLYGVSTSSQSPWLQNMIDNFLRSYAWDQPIRDRYRPDNWPIQIQTGTLFPSSANVVSLGASCPFLEYTDGFGGPPKYYGTLSYDERHKYLVSQGNGGMNLGDETQGLAGIQALPRLDAFVERDKLEVVRFTNNLTFPLTAPSASYSDDGRRVQLFLNAWWGTPTMTWPPPHFIDPISISMHFQPIQAIIDKIKELPKTANEGKISQMSEKEKFLQARTQAFSIPGPPGANQRKMSQGKEKEKFAQLQKQNLALPGPSGANQRQMPQIKEKEKFQQVRKQDPSIPGPPVAPYLRSQAPIGARDTRTLQFLRQNGVQALFSACLTMTLSLPKSDTDGGVLIVDVDIAEHLDGLIPDNVLETATLLTQKLVGDDADDGVLRYVLAFERLLAYSRARLVITNRLHVAMPCVALGTPVIFVHHKALPGGGGNRMDGLDVFMHQMRGRPMPSDFDWSKPPPNPNGGDFKKQVKRINHLTACHSGITDSALKFGIMPTEWAVGDEDEVCTRASAWSTNPEAIHIATTLDANFFEIVFPSWVNSLARSNPNEPFVLYILTIKLSHKQRCLIRLMVSKLLPNAQVFTIPTNVDIFEQSFAAMRRGHISVATQSRLLLPSILPCVRKLLWIDLDAFVVGSLQQAWNQPTGPCGIAARSSIVQYMASFKTYFPTLAKWHENYGKSFNAGVMSIDLQKLRDINFEEEIVTYWAATLGANDQVTFNLACNATHAELDPRMNVFQGVADDETPIREEWIIAHFQSSKKPWSDTWDEKWSSKDFWQVWEDNKMSFEEVIDL